MPEPEHSEGMSSGTDWPSRLLVLVVAGLVLGAAVTVALLPVLDRPARTVAVIPVEGSIDGTSAARVTAQIERARADPSVAAVVLLVNSPGGTAAASETQYLSVTRLAAEKPVVASVDAVAASGAYYTLLPSDAVYAKPASIVGSVGVLAPLPQQVEPNDVIGTTGPDKLSTDGVREFHYRMETLKRAFANAVMAQRGAELTISRGELVEAGVYSGTVAVEAGLVDEIGGTQTAIARAAELAGVDAYRVEVYRTNETVTFVSQTAYLASAAPSKELVSPSYLTGIGTPGATYGTFLLLPPQFAVPDTSGLSAGDDGPETNATASSDPDAPATANPSTRLAPGVVGDGT